MHARGASQWRSKRKEKPTVGNLRRACAASGATWNVQVVRGKMSTQCLWHACRALVLGIILMSVGAGMATIGYYAVEPLGEFRNGTTVRVKQEQKGLHLNNLSYVGPIIMGFGGFIVVASCVMTFEARDSAAKVVPARFKLSGPRSGSSTRSQRRTTSVQSSVESRKPLGVPSNRWEQHLGLFRTSPGDLPPTDRHALTAALVHFSKNLGSPKPLKPINYNHNRKMSKCGSVPNLAEIPNGKVPKLNSGSPSRRVIKQHRGRHSSVVQRSSRDNYLHPGMLRHRHALSVDEPGNYCTSNENSHGSHSSVTFDPYLSIIQDIVPVHKKRDRSKRSDTAKRHVLSRQTPIQHEDPHRRNSTISDDTSRRTSRSRLESAASRTQSFDSRCTQVATGSTAEINDFVYSPEKARNNSPRKVSMLSTPSVDKEFRSQLSICSEPTVAVRNLSCQSSFEPCFPEEEIEQPSEDKNGSINSPESEGIPLIGSTLATIETKVEPAVRPDSLILNSTTIDEISEASKKKFLYRSYSTRSYKKPKPKPPKPLSNDLDHIYVISSNSQSHIEDFYDSIEVIHERRSKNFSKFGENDINNSEDQPKLLEKNA